MEWALVQCNRTWAAEGSAGCRFSAASWEFTKAVNYQMFFLPSRGNPDTLQRACPGLLKHGPESDSVINHTLVLLLHGGVFPGVFPYDTTTQTCGIERVDFFPLVYAIWHALQLAAIVSCW